MVEQFIVSSGIATSGFCTTQALPFATAITGASAIEVGITSDCPEVIMLVIVALPSSFNL